MFHCFSCGSNTTTCAISVLRKDGNCKRIFMFSKIDKARQGSIPRTDTWSDHQCHPDRYVNSIIFHAFDTWFHIEALASVALGFYVLLRITFKEDKDISFLMCVVAVNIHIVKVILNTFNKAEIYVACDNSYHVVKRFIIRCSQRRWSIPLFNK